jgi:hypothetical protein
VTGALRFAWLAAQPSRYRLAFALMADGALAGLALQLALGLFLPPLTVVTPWLAFALILGSLWVLLSVGLYRDRAAYFGAGSRRRRLLGGVLILFYAFLVNEVAGAPLPIPLLLSYAFTFYLSALASRLIARRLLT